MNNEETLFDKTLDIIDKLDEYVIEMLDSDEVVANQVEEISDPLESRMNLVQSLTVIRELGLE